MFTQPVLACGFCQRVSHLIKPLNLQTTLMTPGNSLIVALFLCGLHASTFADTPIRARDLGIPFSGNTGKYNALTDVPGVLVGHTTIIAGEPGPLVIGKGPVRTGVTAIFTHAKDDVSGVAASWFVLNGDGEVTGMSHVQDIGVLYGPIMLTNTISVGDVRNGVIQWFIKNSMSMEAMFANALPVVAETWDGDLNDMLGFHVKQEHVFAALDNAVSGPLQEGNVGGGTGMICYEFKCGIGTASRVVNFKNKHYTTGVLVQANHSPRQHLMIKGIPVGEFINDLMPEYPAGVEKSAGNSIIIIVGTDAPLLPVQLHRIAKRAVLGLARTGSVANTTSGDFVIAFSTANKKPVASEEILSYQVLPDAPLNELFEAVVQATEEAIFNAMIAARTMIGVDGNTVYAIPHERLQSVLNGYNLIRPTAAH